MTVKLGCFQDLIRTATAQLPQRFAGTGVQSNCHDQRVGDGSSCRNGKKPIRPYSDTVRTCGPGQMHAVRVRRHGVKARTIGIDEHARDVEVDVSIKYLHMMVGSNTVRLVTEGKALFTYPSKPLF